MRRFVILAASAAIAAGVLGLASAGERSDRPPAASDASVPDAPMDRGAGERLLLVVGGAFPTREEAEQARAQIRFGELQGFYVARTAQFVGLREFLGTDSDHVLVSAFRTARGAKEFLALATAAGAPAFLTPRLENLGFEYVGLGQESAPDGSGPLTRPIPGVSTG